MRVGRFALVAVFVSIFVLLGAAPPIRLADHWLNRDVERKKLNKIMVVGVTEIDEARRHFENKFVTHLRGRDVEAATGYSLVADLTHIQAEDVIRKEIDDQQIDGVITVRLVLLGKVMSEDAWGEQWKAELTSGKRLRELIDEWLPVGDAKASSYGLEITLWDANSGERLWAGRSDTVGKKLVKKGRSGDFIQLVMGRLREANLL